MSHTHLLYHIVFGTKDHLPLISPAWESELYKYLGGIIRNHKGVPIEINGMPDHAHIFARLEPVEALSDLMRELPVRPNGCDERINRSLAGNVGTVRFQ